MDCPYCKKNIEALTGLQEVVKFEKHLKKCRKNPNNIVVSAFGKTAIVPKKNQDMIDALNIRADSGQ